MGTKIIGLAALLSWTLVAYDFSEATDRAVASIDTQKWLEATEHLSSFNRFYRSSENLQARDWLKEQFVALGLSTTVEPITINGVAGYNVVGEIRGSDRPNEIYIIGAHYDSTSENPMRAAPGAEDNASGTAALLTIASAIVNEKPHATVRFIAFSGEEAGLFGSAQYARKLIAQGEKNKVKGVLIMDMIGFTSDDDLDALIETSRTNQGLIDLLSAARAHYAQGRIETSYHYWGSDHVPFIENGFNAALLIENDYDDYPDYHHSTDLPVNLNKAMAEVIIKTITGTLGYWVL